MKVLLLIITSGNNKLYNKLEEIHTQLTTLNYSWLDIYLIKNVETHTETRLNGNILEFPNKESSGLNIYKKSIKAIEILDKEDSYDFIIRSNLSTFYNFNSLENFLKQHININYILAPLIMYYSYNLKKSSQKIPIDNNYIKFPVGFCIIIPKNIKYQLLGASILMYEEYKNLPDDVIFGYIFNKLGIEIKNIRQHLLLSVNYNISNLLGPKFMYRNRHFLFNNGKQNFDKRYDIEIPVWKELLQYFYNINITP